MAEYRFVTRWHLAAPINTVWQAIVHTETWPTWWQAVETVEELEPGAVDGLGKVWHLVWKTPLSYRLAFKARLITVKPPHTLELHALGDVEGNGLWELASTDRGTEARYTWTVRTTKPWMNALATIARPLLEWNHNAIMDEGGKSLAQYLKVDLISTESLEAGVSTQ